MLMKSIAAVAVKELRQISRDRRTLMILLFVPAFFLLLFGYALNFDIRNVALAVNDQDRSVKSRELVSAFVNSGYFDQVAAVYDLRTKDRLLDTNGARAILTIPEGFSRDLQTGGRPPVPVTFVRRPEACRTACSWARDPTARTMRASHRSTLARWCSTSSWVRTPMTWR